MTTDILLLLGTLFAALVLFSREWVPADVTALGILLWLTISGLLPPDQAFDGFGSDPVIMILGILIMMAALTHTGVTDLVGRTMLRWTHTGERQLLLAVMVAATVIGAFMSNTAATAFFLPIVISLARRAKVSASKLLMPLAFASILASSITLISTSTNMIVSGLMTDYGMPPIGMFELAPVGIPIAMVGVLYMYTVGHRLVPDRGLTGDVEDLGAHLYLTEILVLPGSHLIGKTLAESGLGRDLDLTVLRIVRGDERNLEPGAATRLEENDVLLVEGEKENVLEVKEVAGIGIKADVELSDPDLQAEDMGLTEVILLPRSPLNWRTLKGLRFRDRYGLQVLAINRHGETLSRKMSQIRLRMGDVLVVQGARARIAALERQDIFRVLSPVERVSPNRRRAPIATAIFLGAMVAATFNLLSLPVAALLGALLVFVTRCITPEEAYGQVNWKALILIASMLGLGAAMEHTGTAEFLAHRFVAVVGRSTPVGVLSAFFFLTVLLTQPMSNQAAAVVVLPVAIRTATQLAWNPRAFAMMIAVAASCSFMTPLEPACLLVYGPGHYRFADFPKVGLALSILIYIIGIVLVPVFWPL
ncbi:MAG TPA: SLC13 family permease [Anaerolineae bacterium]|nr:SLC13 family permease [Anaerolineae bacterium]